MPQQLTEWWKEHLGEACDETHELYLNSIGNLTLTAYNGELSNEDFITKKQIFKNSHLEINKYIASLNNWTKTEIEQRTTLLANKALEIWNYFGSENLLVKSIKDITGSIPIELKVLGQHFNVKSWRDVLENTLNVIAEFEPEKFEIISKSFPKHVSKNKNLFRDFRQLKNGYFVKVNNLSAESIKKFCYQVMETIESTLEEWDVVIK